VKSLVEYQRFAERLAKKAGSFALKHAGKIRKIAYKGRMNLVTDVDTKCEKLILQGIKKCFPDHKIISEEAGRLPGEDPQFCWLVDPLDGTTNYAHNFPFYSVSIALMRSDKVVVGVVYDPERDEMFSASTGGGAFLNRKRINVSKIKRLSEGLLCTGFPYKFGRSMKQSLCNFKKFMLKAQAVRRAGSAALDLCYVAMGRFDGFWEIDLHPWDTAAGVLIVQEAGGRVTTFANKPFDPFLKEVLVSNSKIHKSMLGVLR